ncbi:unnamed protein product [Aphis gossypii]|uniref:Uncharacterized protein n=1 Tax=Aphis gossypii TaxID=80765 RepID=A0A9P0J9T3_APHGO|nr:unnamed protein product [Aphis gossypii]
MRRASIYIYICVYSPNLTTSFWGGRSGKRKNEKTTTADYVGELLLLLALRSSYMPASILYPSSFFSHSVVYTCAYTRTHKYIYIYILNNLASVLLFLSYYCIIYVCVLGTTGKAVGKNFTSILCFLGGGDEFFLVPSCISVRLSTESTGFIRPTIYNIYMFYYWLFFPAPLFTFPHVVFAFFTIQYIMYI